ncbi:MAG: hypothetical protein KIS88_09385 [Anaerolineales bacterium]|nr:hypothetical protein [Anaerolineales bacterium]
MITIVCGVAALAWLLSAPSESARAILGGFSAERLGLAAALLAPVLGLSAIAIRWGAIRRQRETFLRWLQVANPVVVACSALLVAFVSAALALLSLDYAITLFGSLALYIQRLQPLLAYLAVLAVAFMLLWLSARDASFDELRKDYSILRASWLVFAGLAGLALIILLSRLGLGHDATRWGAPNAPVLISQVAIALALAFVVLALGKRFIPLRQVDIALAVLIWFIAAVMWLQQPVEPTYYSTAPLAPNVESYPLSDAFNHDVIAQNVQIGQGFYFGGTVATRRPLYVMFLSLLETLLASDYSKVVIAQVMVLALFPAVLFGLATKLHNRFSGLLLAGLVVFRETNSLALGHLINLSHAKLLMADLPAALGLAALGLFSVKWLNKRKPAEFASLLLGGFVGALILLRSQVITVAPVFALCALLVWGHKAWRPVVLLAVGALLVVSPWVLRNKLGTGQFVIEDSMAPGFLANRYSYDPGATALPRLAGETEGEYYARHMAAVRNFTLQDPLYVAGFVADNFVRNQMINFMTLPTSPVLRSLQAHVRELPYWPSWDGALARESWAIVAVNLALVSIGLAASWQRWRWAGLVPLFINLGFTFSLALARVAGWRYNLPADWTVLLYYAIGLGQVVLWLAVLLPGSQWLLESKAAPEPSRNSTPSTKAWVGALAVLLLAGFSYSIIEALSQPRYSKLSAAQALAAAQQVPDAPPQLLALLESGRVDVLHGRALYPTFYEAGRGLEGDFVLTQPQDYSRLSFYLIGPVPAPVLLPLASGEIEFPNASDVIVVRCSSADTDAFAVLLTQTGTIVPSSRMADGCAETP